MPERSMRLPRFVALAGALVLGLALLASPVGAQTSGKPHAADKRQLYELIAREPYRSTWNRLILPVLKDHRWLKGARGVWSPVETITADNATFTVRVLCRPHGCAENRISVIFEVDGRRAVAALRSPAGTQWLGQPGETERKALVAAFH